MRGEVSATKSLWEVISELLRHQDDRTKEEEKDAMEEERVMRMGKPNALAMAVRRGDR